MSRPDFRVLIVDDDPDMRSFLARIISAEGMRTETAPDGDQALAQVARSAPDLVVLDVMLPGTDGFAVCERLKSDPATALLPVVLVTALEDHSSRVRGIRAGADDFLSKPVHREELVARVRTLRRLHETRRELEAGRLAAETARKEALRKAFVRYISPRIAERIIEEVAAGESPFHAGPQRANVVVLFADLRGFTRLTESTQVDAVVGLLNEYFAVITEAAYNHDGTIFSMGGDSLLVGFNVPFPQPNAPSLAWHAAQEMARGVRPVLAQWTARGGMPTGVGFGLAAGDAILGNVGSPHYMSYTIIGDAVNVAARLVAMAKSDELLLSGTVLRQLGEAPPRMEPRGRISLRGRSEPVDVYSVLL